jgi:hypothetical protein
MFTKEPVLKMFQPEFLIQVETDVSDYTIRAVLNQPDDKGRMHPVIFFLRSLGPAELNYNMHNKELLAIVDTLKI